MHKVTEDDGYGGEITRWVDGSHVDVAFSYDSSTEARIAQSQGIDNRFKVTVDKNQPLAYHDVFRRLDDGKIFRITSDGTDNTTPRRSALDMKCAEAEEWVPTNE